MICYLKHQRYLIFHTNDIFKSDCWLLILAWFLIPLCTRTGPNRYILYLYNWNKNNCCKLSGLWLSLSLLCSLVETKFELRHLPNKSISEETNILAYTGCITLGSWSSLINVPATFKTVTVLQRTPQPKLTTQGVRLDTDAVRRLGEAKNPGTAWGNMKPQNWGQCQITETP